MPNLQHIEEAARRKLGAAEGWKGFKFEVVGVDYIVIGEIPFSHYTRGKRKGRPKWTGPGMKVIVTKGDVETEISRYVKETGNCPNCFGSKEEFASWNTKTGLKTKPCAECNATGKA